MSGEGNAAPALLPQRADPAGAARSLGGLQLTERTCTMHSGQGHTTIQHVYTEPWGHADPSTGASFRLASGG